MAHEHDGELAPLINEIITALMDELTDDFTATQVDWVFSAMRGAILPYELRLVLDEDEDLRIRQAALIREDLQEALSGKSAHERWSVIMRMYYVSRLLPLSDEAFDLALQRLNSGQTGDELASKAKALRARLTQLEERMSERVPQVREAFGSAISEAMIDCSYAAGEVELMSLRVGAIHSQRQAGAATCPACGAENSPGSRFCSACGKPLADGQAQA